MIFGSGVVKGMMVTLKSFFTSYFKGPNDGGIFTVEYPEKKVPTKENFRNFPFLLFDNQPDNLRCVACDICAKECPPKCIYIVREFDKDNKPLKRPAVFDIDLTVCMNCGICEEACPFDAIFMDHDFQIANVDRQSHLLYHKEDLLKSNEYFNQIRPTDAGAIDKKRREVEEKKKAASATKLADPSSSGGEEAAKAKAAAAAQATATQTPPKPPSSNS